MIALVWAPILAIGALHYTTAAEVGYMHVILRRLYYLPILFAAFQVGLKGGLLSALLVCLTYAPHAFLHFEHMMHSDPSGPVEKGLEMILYNVVGAVAGYLGDLELERRSELEKALAERERLQEDLVRAGRLSALGEVVAGVAHEVKNPLHALSGTAEVVDGLIPEGTEERRLWEMHKSELSRLERVADRFLSFASPRPSSFGPVDLRDVAERIAAFLEAEARRKGIAVERSVPEQPVIVRGDADQLTQVGVNIALNAVKAIGEAGGTIRVSALTRADGADRAGLRIENDGPPLDEEGVEHLFDPFHTGSPDGTGLGLSISERIAEQHGGTIRAENAGLGVRFTLCLPGA